MNWLRRIALTVIIAGGLLSLLLFSTTYHPADLERAPIVNASDAPLAPADKPIKVLSWNIQFLAGNRDNLFFYSGGTDPWPTLSRTEDVADQVAAIIRAEDPDIVLLQEVDEGADRTHGQNQTQMLIDRLESAYPTVTETYYWKADFVPHPAIMGSAGMKLVTLSKYRLENAKRHALPLISSDDILTRQFNVKRAILTAELPLDNGTRVTVMNTHLSAFAQGDDTMSRQIAKVQSVIGQAETTGQSWILGGDFNLLPSWSAYEALPDIIQSYYNPEGTEIAPLIAAHPSIPSLDQTEGETAALWYTHSLVTDPNRALNKTIDYIFYDKALAVTGARVVQDGTLWISDHMPIVADFKVTP